MLGGGWRLDKARVPWQMREAQSLGTEALAESVRSGESRPFPGAPGEHPRLPGPWGRSWLLPWLVPAPGARLEGWQWQC